MQGSCVTGFTDRSNRRRVGLKRALGKVRPSTNGRSVPESVYTHRHMARLRCPCEQGAPGKINSVVVSDVNGKHRRSPTASQGALWHS